MENDQQVVYDKRMSRKIVFWILIAIVLMGVGARSYELTARSLWFDEAFSWRLVTYPFQEMIERDAADVHPPLYYIALWGWGKIFGTTLLAIRSFSVFFAGLSIASMYLFASSAFKNKAIGIVAALLMALSGWQIAFAWEARMYTFGMFLSLISSWALLKAMRQKEQMPWWWILYAIITVAFAYTHYFAFFTIAAHALFVLGSVIKKTKWRIGEILQSKRMWFAILSGIIMVATFFPWLKTFLKQNAQVQENYWVPAIGGWSIPDTFYRMLAPTSLIPAHTGTLNLIIAILPLAFISIIWVWLMFGVRKNQDAAWFVALSGFIPFLLAISLSFVSQSLYQDRFLVFTHAFILIGIAVLLVKMKPRFLRIPLTILVCLGFIYASVNYWNELDIPSKGGAHAATQYVFNNKEEKEPIVVSSPFVFFAVDHYAREEFNNTTIPKLYSATGEFLHFAGGPILSEEDFTNIDTISKSDTIWMVDTTGFGGTKLELPEEWKAQDEQTFQEVFTHQADVFVTKYTRF